MLKSKPFLPIVEIPVLHKMPGPSRLLPSFRAVWSRGVVLFCQPRCPGHFEQNVACFSMFPTSVDHLGLHSWSFMFFLCITTMMVAPAAVIRYYGSWCIPIDVAPTNRFQIVSPTNPFRVHLFSSPALDH